LVVTPKIAVASTASRSLSSASSRVGAKAISFASIES